MFFFLSKVLDLLLSPYTWGVGLMALGLPFRRRRRGPRPWARALSLAGLVVLLVCSLDPVANHATLLAEAGARPADVSGKRYDAVILLGGLVEDRPMIRTGQRAYNGNVERLLAAFELVQKGVAERVIVSGGSPTVGSGITEAGVLADQLVEWGVPRERVVLEAASRNTRENAVYSMRIARERGYGRLLLLTSAFHMRRSLGCFAAVGAFPDPYPVDFRAYEPGAFRPSLQPRVEYLFRTTEMLRELAGRTVYRLQGYAVYDRR